MYDCPHKTVSSCPSLVAPPPMVSQLGSELRMTDYQVSFCLCEALIKSLPPEDPLSRSSVRTH